MNTAPRRVLLVASGGGHWVQLLRLREAFAGLDCAYVTVQASYASQLPPGTRFHVVADATRWDRLRLVVMLLQMSWVMLRERPQVVVTTGAAPGVAALRLGKWLGARTVWIDSVANAEEMSMSGQKVRGFADLWLTQWPELARPEGPQYRGSVL